MKIPKWIKPFFIAAGLYDGILGLLFLLIPSQLFSMTNVPPPNHMAYIQFPALLLVTFGIMFINIARDPLANRNLIIYGILLKISYCSIVFLHWFAGNMPFIWVTFAFCDFAFLITFITASSALKKC